MALSESYTQCDHFESAVKGSGGQHILAKFKKAIAWDVTRSHAILHQAKRRKLSTPTCGTCRMHLSRPFVCLHCTYTGCWSDDHVSNHLKKSGHLFCVDTKSGSVFCSACDDFIYSPVADDVQLSARMSAEEKQTQFQVDKKLREPYHSWTPSSKDTSALEGAIAIPCQGRRGLLNLGQTCFMNVVLQSFLHNPLLRNYFLSDKHNSKLCKVRDCTCCQMDRLFAEIYSPDVTAPFGPTSFLATTWRSSSELSGYSQQDAHEFFISALNQIHTTSRGSTNVTCNCVIHSTFAGLLQSDVTCERCGNVTSTADPMLDVSLELKGKAGEPAGGENTLAGCLRRFTTPEKLGPKEYSCSKCKTSHESNKRLSIRKLPPVLSFQFKRFEHKGPNKTNAQKIDTPVRFPAELNMAPYTTMFRNASERNGKGDSTPPNAPGPEIMYQYDLFAVINHEGQIDNGHYTSFARSGDEWYRFDDDKVTHSSLGACLNAPAPAYMCFYVKRHLDYKPYMTPTYVMKRESEAVKEKEMEKEKEAARMKEVEDALLATV